MFALLKDVPFVNNPVFRIVLGSALIAVGVALLHDSIILIAIGALILLTGLVSGGRSLTARVRRQPEAAAAATVPGLPPQTVPPARSEPAGPPATPPDGCPPPPAARPSGRAVLAGLVSVALNFVVPVLAYYLIRPHTSSSAGALALSGAIPVAWTLAVLAVRRKLSALGVISVALFALGVLASWLSGGSTLALELQDPVVTGLFGLACLVSIAVGRPLHQVVLRLMGRSNPRYLQVADRAAANGTSVVSTLIIGLAFLSHAVAVAVLALTQTTSTFLALQNVVGLPLLGLGIAGLFIYATRQQARQRAAAQAAGDDQPGGNLAKGTA